MNIAAITNGPVGESLNIEINTDINNQLHNAFAVRYSANPAENIILDLANVTAECLESPQIFETWHGVSTSASSGAWRIFSNDQYLLASVPSSLLDNLPIDQATEKAYTLVFQQMDTWGYPFLLRTWNFFPDITGMSFGNTNNYQQFCSGRARAYANHSLKTQSYPAATVVGTQQQGLQIYFIAAKLHGIGIENTQQISAFEYPTIYSEDPPLFSRALLHRNQSQQILFVSGTASITGHNTQHEDDVNRQIEVCLNNIEHLLSTAIAEHQFSSISLQDFSQFKVYIKHPDNINTVRTHLQQLLGPSAPIYYLQGDMCRSDLLVEIEALAITQVI